jgi:hypothetical protein
MSWLADDQMHKMGYPNLNTPGYSEEDSRDAPDGHIEESRRSTRHSSDVNSNKRREIKNPKYLYDYETNEVSSRRRRSEIAIRSSDRNKKELRSRRESNDKENNEETSMNGRGHDRSRKTDGDEDSEKKSEDTAEDDSNDSTKVLKENGVETNPEEEKAVVKNEENKSSESDIVPKMRPKAKSEKLMMNQNFTRRRTRNRKPFGKRSHSREANVNNKKLSDSSSSESEGVRKGYSLRNRPPKPPPSKCQIVDRFVFHGRLSVKSSAMRSHDLPRTRKRFTRRRKVSSSSSSSSSDSDVRHEKYWYEERFIFVFGF